MRLAGPAGRHCASFRARAVVAQRLAFPDAGEGAGAGALHEALAAALPSHAWLPSQWPLRHALRSLPLTFHLKAAALTPTAGLTPNDALAMTLAEELEVPKMQALD